MEFAGTAQGLAWPAGVGVLAGVMDQEDGQSELALQFPKIREQGGDLGGIILIDAVQPDQRVEDQEHRVMLAKKLFFRDFHTLTNKRMPR